MSVYVDASAFLRTYLDEPGRREAGELLMSDPGWVTGRHTAVEVRRNLARDLSGAKLAGAREQFELDWDVTHVVELNEATCDIAAGIAEVTGVRTLDALHLGAAQRVGGGSLPILTFDARLARAARKLGWEVREIR